jgi:formylmethanofuran dehydrogenase subunit E
MNPFVGSDRIYVKPQPGEKVCYSCGEPYRKPDVTYKNGVAVYRCPYCQNVVQKV